MTLWTPNTTGRWAVRANNAKVCYEAAYPSDDSSPPSCQEIAGASDEQMAAWVAQIEQAVLDATNDPALNGRIVAWYLGPEELHPNIPREKELLQRLYGTGGIDKNWPIGLLVAQANRKPK